MAILAYAPDAEDFTTAGLAGDLVPTSCLHEEYAGGASELVLEHPLDEWGKWRCLEAGVILKAPTPVRTTPQFDGGSIVTAVEKWTVKASASKADRCICSDGQLRRRRCLVPGGTELTVAGRNETVAKVKSGRYGNGYMKLSALQFEQAEVIADDPAAIEQVEGAWSVRDQLFRVYKVEKADTGVTAWARRIFYDLAEILTDWHCTVPQTAQQALDGVLGAAMMEHPFRAYTNSANQRTGLYYERKNVAWALLDPEEGIAKQYQLECVRDDFELYFLTRAGLDRGVVIEYGKNLRGVHCEVDESGVATRVMPVGSDRDGKPLLLDQDPPWLESSHAQEYPTAKMTLLQCSGECRVSDSVNYAQARQRMREEAQALLDGGCDMPTVSLRVDFLNLGDTVEYAQYRELERVFLYDRVTVRVARLGIDVQLDVARTVFDCLRGRYEEVELGALGEISGSIQAWQLPSDISGGKIRLGSVGSGQLSDGVIATRHLQAGSITAESAAIANAAIGTAQIQDAAITSAKVGDLAVTRAKIADAAIGAAQIDSAAVTYAKIAQAAVTQISADALAAVQARVRELVAGSITTDQLYADLAAIAVAQLTTANIGRANIDWASINTLAACIAQIASAEIGTAKIDYAKIVDSVTDTAIISQGEAGKLFIARLAVTDANMVSLTAGELLLKAADGSFVRLVADGQGGVTSQTVQVEGDNIAQATIPGGKLIENSITARELNVSSIFADQALIRAIKAANIDVADLFAAQATIEKLDSWIVSANTIQALQGQLNLWAEEKIESRVSGKADAATAVASVQVQYAQSSSAAVAPASGWSATAPAWEEGKVMWQRTVTTYADSHSETSAPTCLSGATGAAGEDATVLRIDSSRGTVFKNNQVATVLSAVIYHGSERVDTIAALRRVYGSGAYLQWSWQRMDEERYGVISADDSRIGQDGFTLTLSPADVDVKVSFMCELITD